MSELYQSLSHSKWDCKYHVVVVFVDAADGGAAARRHTTEWMALG